MVLSVSLSPPAPSSSLVSRWWFMFRMVHVNQLLINPNGVNECRSGCEWFAPALINMTSHIHTANHWLSDWETDTYTHTHTEDSPWWWPLYWGSWHLTAVQMIAKLFVRYSDIILNEKLNMNSDIWTLTSNRPNLRIIYCTLNPCHKQWLQACDVNAAKLRVILCILRACTVMSLFNGLVQSQKYTAKVNLEIYSLSVTPE